LTMVFALFYSDIAILIKKIMPEWNIFGRKAVNLWFEIIPTDLKTNQ